jgi:ACS family tartrate transporter-like MFS transporter
LKARSWSDDAAVIAKLTRRLIPLFVVMFFVNYLDRTNIGIAALAMNADLRLTPVDYGVAAGIFSLAYALCGIPANVLFHRIGARRWLGAITIAWGLVALGTGFVFDKLSLNVARLALGVAEAGFTPGVLLYLTQWFPSHSRGQAFAIFTAGNPIATILGGPLSATILVMPGLGLWLHNWQWLFIIEALPAIFLGAFVLVYLDDRPANAKWLTPSEKQWLAEQLALEEQTKVNVETGVLNALRNGPTLALSLCKFLDLTCSIGVVMWLPQIIASFGHLTTLQVSFANGVPFLLAAGTAVVVARHSDRTGERTWHVAAPAFLGTAGFLLVALTDSMVLDAIGICIATIGFWTSNTVGWTLSPKYLSGAALASGLALVNSVGNLGGFVGPFVIGWLRQASGGFRLPLAFLAGVLAVNGLVVVALQAFDRRGAASRSARAPPWTRQGP